MTADDFHFVPTDTGGVAPEGDGLLHGSRGDDTPEGGWGDDILRGSKGNDTLESGRGAETFVFREGDGNDTVHGFGFGESDEYLPKDGRNTVISYGDEGDTITLGGVKAGSLIMDDFGFVFVG